MTCEFQVKPLRSIQTVLNPQSPPKCLEHCCLEIFVFGLDGMQFFKVKLPRSTTELDRGMCDNTCGNRKIINGAWCWSNLTFWNAMISCDWLLCNILISTGIFCYFRNSHGNFCATRGTPNGGLCLRCPPCAFSTSHNTLLMISPWTPV